MANKKSKDKNQLRANGHINIPNVNSPNECIGLTYTIRGAKDLDAVKKIETALDKLHDLECFVNVEMTHWGTDEQEIIAKYKIKACGTDKDARKVKEKCDKYLKGIGGQTTLDVETTDEAVEE